MSIRQGTRIGFIGAGGTGKTTTAKWLEGALAINLNIELPLVKSASRTAYEENGLTEELVAHMTPQEKLNLQTVIFEAKIKLDQQYEYIADRTLLDHYAYCLAYCGDSMENAIYRGFEERVRTLMLSTYSHIFFFPWGYWTPESDGVRQDRQSWQSLIDSIMVGYIMRWNLPAIWVPQVDGDVSAAGEFIYSSIKGEHPKGEVV